MVGVFAYASLVSEESASETLGRPITPMAIADLHGFRRTWSVARDNRLCEKTFARPGDGWVPDYVLLLNLVKTQMEGTLNGVLYAVSESEMQRLADRERRYRPVEVGGCLAIRPESRPPNSGRPSFKNLFTFVGRPEHTVSEPPPNSCLLSSYLATVTAGYRNLGSGELETFNKTTGSHGVEAIKAKLISGDTEEGLPPQW